MEAELPRGRLPRRSLTLLFVFGLLDQVLDQLFLLDALLLNVGLLDFNLLGRFRVLKDGHIVPLAVEEAGEGLALAFLRRVDVLERGPEAVRRGITWL